MAIGICFISYYAARVRRKQAQNANIPLANRSNSQEANQDATNSSLNQPPPSTFKRLF